MHPTEQRVVERTSALVAIRSDDREAEVQDLVADWLDAAGFACELQEVSPGRPNLVARRGSGGPFLCSHADTHPAHDHPDPFACRREGEVLVGRGVVDAKGQIAALVAAVEAEPTAPATIVITCDEETGGTGSEQLALPDAPPSGEGGIVLEPTGLRVCVAQGGCIELALEAHGAPAHVAAPEGGVSALDILLGAIDALGSAQFLTAEHPLFEPRGVHVGTLAAGEHRWRLPARATAEVSLPLAPGVDPAAARAEAEDVLSALDRAWARGETLSWTVLDVCEPIEVSPALGVVERLRDAMGDLTLGGMPSWTDAGHLLLRHGIPCVVFGAGDLGSAHSDREWVRVEELVGLSAILRRLVADYLAR